MSKAKEAAASFEKSVNCAQAVFSTYSEALGLDKETALKVACGFGAGMGRQSETCGAVSGAYMLIGLKHGNTAPEDGKGKEKTYEMIQGFSKEFIRRNGSTKCKDLLGMEILMSEKTAVNQKCLQTCPRLVQDAAEIVETMLELA